MPACLSPRLVVLGLFLSLLGGCTYSASSSAPGSLTIHLPGNAPPAAQPEPLRGSLPPAPLTGRYAGIGTLSSDPGGRNRCRATVQVTGFVVRGNQVTFRGGRGTIDASGRLDMQMGHRFVSGRFVGNRFEGRWWQPPPDCAYWMTLDPVG